MAQVDGAAQFAAEAEELTAEERRFIQRLRADRNTGSAGADKDERVVIEPDGTAVDERDDYGKHVIQNADGEWVDARDGTRLEQDDRGAWAPAKVWPHQTLTYMGDLWEYRQPKQLGAMFLGIASRKNASAKRKLDAVIGYLEHTLSPASLQRMEDRAFDHDDEFDAEHMGELVRRISTGESD